MNTTQNSQTETRFTDRFAAEIELDGMLSEWNAQERVCYLLDKHAGTAVGRALTETMTDEWSQGNHLGSLHELRMMWDRGGRGVWPLALRLLADRGLVVTVTFTREAVAVTPPTPNMAAPDEPHWVCFTCNACDSTRLETTDDEGTVLEVCSVCGVPRSPPRPPGAVRESIFGPWRVPEIRWDVYRNGLRHVWVGEDRP